MTSKNNYQQSFHGSRCAAKPIKLISNSYPFASEPFFSGPAPHQNANAERDFLINLWAREGRSKEERIAADPPIDALSIGPSNANGHFLSFGPGCLWSPTSFGSVKHGHLRVDQNQIWWIDIPTITQLIFWMWAKGMAVTDIDQDAAVDQWMFLHHPSSLRWLLFTMNYRDSINIHHGCYPSQTLMPPNFGELRVYLDQECVEYIPFTIVLKQQLKIKNGMKHPEQNGPTCSKFFFFHNS